MAFIGQLMAYNTCKYYSSVNEWHFRLLVHREPWTIDQECHELPERNINDQLKPLINRKHDWLARKSNKMPTLVDLPRFLTIDVRLPAPERKQFNRAFERVWTARRTAHHFGTHVCPLSSWEMATNLRWINEETNTGSIGPKNRVYRAQNTAKKYRFFVFLCFLM